MNEQAWDLLKTILITLLSSGSVTALITRYFEKHNHLTVDGTVYDRSGEEYDYDNSYYSWKNGSSVIYTTNAINPAVGDTVYTKNGTTYTASGTIEGIA